MTDTNQHPITPPPELVQQWVSEIWHEGSPVRIAASCLPVANQAAQWGWEQRDATVPAELQQARDEELEACVENVDGYNEDGARLRAARRPKPPSLKEQALAALKRRSTRSVPSSVATEDFDTIHRALEQLP